MSHDIAPRGASPEAQIKYLKSLNKIRIGQIADLRIELLEKDVQIRELLEQISELVDEKGHPDDEQAVFMPPRRAPWWAFWR